MQPLGIVCVYVMQIDTLYLHIFKLKECLHG